jgi:hypothetical protein
VTADDSWKPRSLSDKQRGKEAVNGASGITLSDPTESHWRFWALKIMIPCEIVQRVDV